VKGLGYRFAKLAILDAAHLAVDPAPLADDSNRAHPRRKRFHGSPDRPCDKGVHRIVRERANQGFAAALQDEDGDQFRLSVERMPGGDDRAVWSARVGPRVWGRGITGRRQGGCRGVGRHYRWNRGAAFAGGTAGLVNRTVRSRAKRSRPKRVDARPGETPESGEAGTLVDPVGI
jgi:hypothetical protein